MAKCKCPLCEYSSTYGRLEKHLKIEHGIESIPDAYIDLVLGGDNSLILCPCGCGMRTTWINWKEGFSGNFLRGHNARSDDPTIAGAFKQESSQRKAADARRQGYRSGKYKVWNKGLSNHADERVKNMHAQASETIRESYADGMLSWQKQNPDKHKIACDRLSISKRLSIGEVQRRIENLPLDLEILSDLREYKTRQTTLLRFSCNVCNAIWEKTLKNIEDTPKCIVCHPTASYNQLEIYNFISELVGNESVLLSDRKLISPKELDIYVPSRNFAVEFNGLTFHTEVDVPKDYHDEKTRRCRENGVTLFHVFGDEWRGDKRPIVESMIRSRLGASHTRIFARNCKVVQLSPAERKAFFEKSHLDGDVRSTIAWGLRDSSGNIVSALSLRVPFHKRYMGWSEVARCASALNHSVPGAVGRLVSVAKKWARDQQKLGLVSYADLRHGRGGSYEKVGFLKHSTTDIRFWWTDKSKRYDRFRYRANRSRNMTERDVAAEAGVVRIYGCRNRVLTLKL